MPICGRDSQGFALGCPSAAFQALAPNVNSGFVRDIDSDSKRPSMTDITLREFQQLIRGMYHDKDVARGIDVKKHDM